MPPAHSERRAARLPGQASQARSLIPTSPSAAYEEEEAQRRAHHPQATRVATDDRSAISLQSRAVSSQSLPQCDLCLSLSSSPLLAAWHTRARHTCCMCACNDARGCDRVKDASASRRQSCCNCIGSWLTAQLQRMLLCHCASNLCSWCAALLHLSVSEVSMVRLLRSGPCLPCRPLRVLISPLRAPLRAAIRTSALTRVSRSTTGATS